MLQLIETLFSYDAWATDRLLAAMERGARLDFRSTPAGTDGLFEDVMAGLLRARWRLFAWLDDCESGDETVPLTIPLDRVASVTAAREQWAAIKEQGGWAVASLEEDDLHAWHEADEDGPAAPLWTRLLQVATDGTGARARLAAAMAQAGYVAPAIDFASFLEEMRSPLPGASPTASATMARR